MSEEQPIIPNIQNEAGRVTGDGSAVRRNLLILETVKDHSIPVLPFEVDRLRIQYQRMVDEQGENAVLLASAMTETSETFHDNSPAEAINLASVRLHQRARRIQGIGDRTVIFEYPNPDSLIITLGSIIGYRAGRLPERYVVLTGVTSDRERKQAQGHEVTLISLNSPLGKVLLGTTVGQAVHYEVTDRNVNVEVTHVEQLTPDIAVDLV